MLRRGGAFFKAPPLLNLPLQITIRRSKPFQAIPAIGTAFSFNGPPLAVYASLSGWREQASKAGLAATFIVTAGLMLVAQVFAGVQNASTVTAALIGAPGALFGAWLGFKISRGIGEKTYRKLFFAFIACPGLAFLQQTVQALL